MSAPVSQVDLTPSSPEHGRAQPSVMLSGVRVKPHEAALIRAAALQAGLKPAVWMRQALLEVASRAATVALQESTHA